MLKHGSHNTTVLYASLCITRFVIKGLHWTTNPARPFSLRAERENLENITPSLKNSTIFSKMLDYMKPGENVAKALRRLGGNKGKQMTTSQRWKAKKQKSENQSSNEADIQRQKDKEDFLKLTGLADEVLQTGNMEVYEMTHEKLTYELKKSEKSSEKIDIPEGTNDDDALDMFADDFDKKETDKVGIDLEKLAENGTDTKAAGNNKGTHYIGSGLELSLQ